MLGYVQGMPVYKSNHCVVMEQYRFPKSKKKRIRKKWRKETRNFKCLPDPQMYLLKDKAWIGHPATIQKLMEKVMGL
jgi:hypothetical protein